jgi:Ca2+-binding EF-hand superfamily protein
MFDLDGSGTIDLNEFKHIINANKRDSKVKIENIDTSGLVKHLFGPEGTKKLSFKDFLEFIDSFKEQLLLHEFLMYDVEGKNEISVEAFNELITRSVHLNSLNVPEFKRQLNLLKTRGFFKPSGRVNFETFKAFHIMSEHIEDLHLAMQLYASGGRELKKEDFTKILHKVLNVSFPPNVIDLVFALFDKNGDGNLSLKEFISVVQKRNNYLLMLQNS